MSFLISFDLADAAKTRHTVNNKDNTYFIGLILIKEFVKIYKIIIPHPKKLLHFFLIF